MPTSNTSSSRTLVRGFLLVLAVLLLVPFLMMVLMMPMMGLMGGMWGTGTMMPPVWGLGMMVVVVLVLLGVEYALYQAFTSTVVSRDPVLEELRLAYARGDLSQEEFEQRQADLQQ